MASTSQILQQIYSIGISSPDLSRQLYRLLQADDREKYLISLQGSKLTRLVNFLDKVLDAIPNTDDVARRCQHRLQTICSRHAILPSSYNVSSKVKRVGEDPVASGGNADVWKGTHRGKTVCIKYLRMTQQSREEVEKAFCKEAAMWKRLRHPNVVPFIGVTRKPLQFVSEWMPNGTLTEYLNKVPDTDRIRLLLDVAEGLTFLHVNRVTHGDLKGPNILIDQSGRARLTDFGLASVVRDLKSVCITKVRGFTIRWAAPEILESGDKSTQEADVFAFGMVVIEVFTGKVPFSEFSALMTIPKIVSGERPDRPKRRDLSNPIWKMTRACWRQDPVRRPAMTEVVGILRECASLDINHRAGVMQVVMLLLDSSRRRIRQRLGATI